VLSGLRISLYEGSYASSSENELLVFKELDSEEDTYDWAVNLNLFRKTGASLLELLFFGYLRGSPIGSDFIEVSMNYLYG
jgi:hypothetical protein